MQPDDAFDAAFPVLYAAAYRAAIGLTDSAEAAEDAANEALFRASVRWSQVQRIGAPWVVRVASNLAIDHLRRKARRGRVQLDVDRTATDTSGEAVRCIDLHRAIEALPRRQREVVVLRYFADLSETEISDVLGIAAGTVNSHASRGLETLRTSLGDNGPPPRVATGANHD